MPAFTQNMCSHHVQGSDNWRTAAEVFLILQRLHTFKFYAFCFNLPYFPLFSAGESSIHTMTPVISPAPLPYVLDGAGQSMGQLSLALGFLQQGRHCRNTLYISLAAAPCLTETYTPNRWPPPKSRLPTGWNFRYQVKKKNWDIWSWQTIFNLQKNQEFYWSCQETVPWDLLNSTQGKIR